VEGAGDHHRYREAIEALRNVRGHGIAGDVDANTWPASAQTLAHAGDARDAHELGGMEFEDLLNAGRGRPRPA
jgi:hypothetical protein